MSTESDHSEKPAKKLPFYKTDLGKTALFVLAIILIYPSIHSFLIKQAVKGPAPVFEAKTLTGELVSIPPKDGQPVLVHFWATWCPICEHERPDIERIAKEFNVINIAIQSGSDQEVIAFAEQNSMNTKWIVNDATNRHLENLYQAHGVPASFVIDGQGEIHFVKHGYNTYANLKEQLTGLLPQTSK